MKKIIFCCFTIVAVSCNNNNKTNNNATLAAVTSANYFTCKIDGVNWQSDETNGGFAMGMLALNGAREKENDYITLPIDSTAFAPNKTLKINKSKLIQMVSYGVIKPLAIYAATDYEIHLTKATSTIAEGDFSFTAYSEETKKTVHITDGKFNIQLGKK